MKRIKETDRTPIEYIGTPKPEVEGDELKIYAVKNRQWFDITDQLGGGASESGDSAVFTITQAGAVLTIHNQHFFWYKTDGIVTIICQADLSTASGTPSGPLTVKIPFTSMGGHTAKGLPISELRSFARTNLSDTDAALMRIWSGLTGLTSADQLQFDFQPINQKIISPTFNPAPDPGFIYFSAIVQI